RITGPIRERRARGEKHPVLDFLLDYYPYSLTKLAEWHPGIGVALESCPEAHERHAASPYTYTEMLHVLDPSALRPKQRERFRWIRNLLAATRDRPPNFSCHGLHEWAMVYGGTDVRHHDTVPLRLAQGDIDALVESRPVCCSHFDAFRFFTPASKPLNKLQPGLWTREEHEQAGCLHANMDLYKWAFKSMPWAGSDLLADAFELAIAIRAVDMRASPYDLRSFGYEPIAVETEDGRREYESHQRAFTARAAPLRARLIARLDMVLETARGESFTS
ncbi:MAG: 3-methyladenine DNA glycosylase, partial [Akkermansiaceae bacterium]|nr:3-methyladenine DNA glycosylase [Akkermansiaceae bacterium]